jgi:hypothetical protein
MFVERGRTAQAHARPINMAERLVMGLVASTDIQSRPIKIRPIKMPVTGESNQDASHGGDQSLKMPVTAEFNQDASHGGVLGHGHGRVNY